jgi:hypothetical protein
MHNFFSGSTVSKGTRREKLEQPEPRHSAVTLHVHAPECFLSGRSVNTASPVRAQARDAAAADAMGMGRTQGRIIPAMQCSSLPCLSFFISRGGCLPQLQVCKYSKLHRTRLLRFARAETTGLSPSATSLASCKMCPNWLFVILDISVTVMDQPGIIKDPIFLLNQVCFSISRTLTFF